jgi:hypothetical protein
MSPVTRKRSAKRPVETPLGARMHAAMAEAGIGARGLGRLLARERGIANTSGETQIFRWLRSGEIANPADAQLLAQLLRQPPEHFHQFIKLQPSQQRVRLRTQEEQLKELQEQIRRLQDEVARHAEALREEAAARTAELEAIAKKIADLDKETTVTADDPPASRNDQSRLRWQRRMQPKGKRDVSWP